MNEQMKFRELVSRYIDGEVAPEEKTLLEEMLKRDPALYAYYQEQLKLSQILAEWNVDGPSPDWEQRVHSHLLSPQQKEREPMKTNMTRSLIGIASVCVIILSVFSLQVYVKRGVQGRLKSATDDIGDQYSTGNTDIKKMAHRYARHDKPPDQFDAAPSSTASEIKLAKAQSAGDKVAGKDMQYEPYYLDSKYSVVKSAENASQPSSPFKAGRERGYSTTAPQVFAPAISGTRPEMSKTKVVDQIAKTERDRSGAYNLDSTNGRLRRSDVKEAQAPREEEGRAAGYEYYGTTLPLPESIPVEPADTQWRYNPDFQTENYARIYENEFQDVIENAVSTFSIDVDTASYSNIRRYLNSGQLPPEDAVRIEEMVNYFSYDYPQPEGNVPFFLTMQGAACPWNPAHALVMVGLQGKVLSAEEIPPSNLVFLIDVSGSMAAVNKLPLLKSAFKSLVSQLSANERVAIVVYAGSAGLVLESTPGNNKQKIFNAIDELQSGGSTAGAAGINLAYEVAQANFIAEGNNRIILATDGDFNVGVSSDAELVRMIEEKRNNGIFLTILGFGMGNYKDNKMEQLANKGNGGFYYIDSENEAYKVLVTELGSTLFTIAKDVKIQVEFNPAQVKAYRLLGYENRLLAKEDFNDDTKDAGELGAGHTVTAMYEIVPADSAEEYRKSDELVYQRTKIVQSDDVLTIKLRYKDPDSEISRLLTKSLQAEDLYNRLNGDLQFAAAVTEFGLLLRNSQFKGEASYEQVLANAHDAKGEDEYGYRSEFIELVLKARSLDHRSGARAADGINFKGMNK